MGALSDGDDTLLHNGCRSDREFFGGVHVFSVRCLQIYPHYTN